MSSLLMQRNLLFPTLLITITTFAQHEQLTHIIPPAPEPAKLVQFEITPTTLYTGAHNLSVPLHTINFDGMQLPISLSYHSGGIKANEDAGWVGLGWALNITGTISRTVNGYDDLREKSPHMGFVYDQQVIPETIAFQDAYFNHLNGARPDTEPDVFHYNFFGHSGRFTLGKKIEPHEGELVPYPIPVIKLSEDPNRILYNEWEKSFTITTPEGFVGEFTVKELTTNFSGARDNFAGSEFDACGEGNIVIQQMENDGRTRVPTTWYLSRITSPRNRTIDFIYDLNPDGSSNYVTVSPAYFAEEQSYATTTNIPDVNTNVCSKVVHERVYLSEIVSEDVPIRVQLTTEERLDIKSNDMFADPTDPGSFPEAPYAPPRKLTHIQVTDNSGNSSLNKNISFVQSYFNEEVLESTNPNNAIKHRFLRLKLDKALIDDQTYSFKYFDGLPDKTTKGRDYWDYYNGKDANEHLVPPSFLATLPFNSQCQVLSEFQYYQDEERKANFDFGQAGLLYQVTYPTGGYTIYDYEGHLYKLTDNEVVAPEGGGWYIVSGLDVDGLAAFDYTGFHLAGGNCSQAIKVTFRTYCRNHWNGEVCTVDGGDQSTVAAEVIDNQTGQAVASVTYSGLGTTSTGNSVVEANQTLEIGPGNYSVKAYGIDDQNGITKYYGWALVEFPAGCDQAPPSAGDIVSDNVKAGGARIAAISNYDSDGTLAEKRTYTYQDGSIPTLSSGKLIVPLRSLSALTLFEGEEGNQCAWFLTSGSSIPGANAARGNHIGYSRVVEVFEDEAGNTIGQKEYTYDNQETIPLLYGQTSVSYENTNGQLRNERVFDQSLSSLVKHTDFNDIFDDTGMVRGLKYTEKESNLAFIHDFEYRAQFVAPKEIIETEHYAGGGSMVTQQHHEYNNNYLLKKSTTTRSDGKTEESIIKRAADYSVAGSSLISEMRGKHLVAPAIEQIRKVDGEVVEASAVKYAYHSGDDMVLKDEEYRFNPDLGAFEESSNAIVFNSYELRSRFSQYDNKGNLREFTGSEGVTTVFLWGYDQNFPVAKIENASLAQVDGIMGVGFHAGSGPLDGTQINNLKSGLPDAMITTFTYRPGVGLATVTDPNGITTTYEYDDFSRLQVVRDNNGDIVSHYRYHYAEQ